MITIVVEDHKTLGVTVVIGPARHYPETIEKFGKMQRPRTKPVVVIGPFPPPLQGQARMTADFKKLLQDVTRVYAYDVSAGRFAHSRWAPLVKLLLTSRATLMLFYRRWSAPTLYLVLDGGHGLKIQLMVIIAARALRFRMFVHHHTYAYIDQESSSMRAIAALAGQHCTHVVLSPGMGRSLRHRYPIVGRTIEFSSSAFEPPVARLSRRESEPMVLGFLSNLIIEKGVDTAIEVLRQGLRRKMPLKLVLAGRSTDRFSTDLVRQAQSEFGNSFEYLGPIAEHEKDAFFAGLDAFVFPTRYVNEAQPRVVIEALVHGVPVFTYARGSLSELFSDNSTFCFPPDVDFADASLRVLEEWIADPGKAAAAARQATELGATLYAMGQQQLQAIIGELSFGA